MSNIVLIGMPGCGKSTVGVILAKTLGIGFVDTDLIIQQREKRLLQEIIDSDGELIILQVTEEDGEFYLDPIEDDKLFDKIGKLFEERLADYFEFDEE